MTPSSGSSGASTLKLSIAANTTTTSRIATIKVTNSDRSEAQIIKVTQAAFLPELKVGTTSLSVSAEEETKSTTITSNIPWKASCDASWISLSSTSGTKGSSTLKFTIKANSNTSSRSTTIQVYNTEYGISRDIKISQSKFDAQISFSESSISVSEEEVTKTVTVNSNVSWRASCDASWVSLSNTSGAKGSSNLKFTIKANTTTSSRSTTIKVYNTEYNVTKEIKISQSKFVPEITFSESSISTSEEEVTKTLTVKSNVSWKASCDANWVSLSSTSGTKGSSTLKFTIKANTTTASRSTTIKVYNTEYSVTKEIKISQSEFEPEITLSEYSISVPIEEVTKSVTINSNISWKASCDANWISLSSTGGAKGSFTLKLTIRANSTTASRSAIVKVYNTDYNITKEIKISQNKFEPEITLSEYSISASSEEFTKNVTINSNISWKTSCDASWASLSSTSGVKGTYTLKLTIRANSNTASRSATIKVYNTDYNITKEINITQEAFVPTITLSNYSFSAKAEEEVTKTLTVNSNISWSATASDASWIAVRTQYGSAGTSTLSFTIMPNTVTSVRTGTIKVYSNTYDTYKEIKITQEAFEPFITADTKSIIVTADYTIFNVTVTSNINWSCYTDVSWAGAPHGYGSAGTSSLELRFSNNYDNVKRYGTLTIYSNYYDPTVTISLRQDQYNAIFYGSKNNKVITPNNIGSFGANIVSNTCSNIGKGVILFDGPIEKVPSSAFDSNTNLTSVSSPDSVTEIGNYAFHCCTSLTDVTLHNGLKTIGVWAFNRCDACETITIPESVTSIGTKAFHDNALDVIYCKPTTPPAGSSEMFYKNFVIYVPRASVSAYKSAPYWSGYAGAIVGYDF